MKAIDVYENTIKILLKYCFSHKKNIQKNTKRFYHGNFRTKFIKPFPFDSAIREIGKDSVLGKLRSFTSLMVNLKRNE